MKLTQSTTPLSSLPPHHHPPSHDLPPPRSSSLPNVYRKSKTTKTSFWLSFRSPASSSLFSSFLTFLFLFYIFPHYIPQSLCFSHSRFSLSPSQSFSPSHSSSITSAIIDGLVWWLHPKQKLVSVM